MRSSLENLLLKTMATPTETSYLGSGSGLGLVLGLLLGLVLGLLLGLVRHLLPLRHHIYPFLKVA